VHVAASSADKETYASMLDELAEQRGRMDEILAETQPDAVFVRMAEAAALHRSGMELLQRIQRLGASAKSGGFMFFLDKLTMLQMQLKVGFLLQFEILKVYKHYS
jgi:hypothetical protein